jgi:hypothetical protein
MKHITPLLLTLACEAANLPLSASALQGRHCTEDYAICLTVNDGAYRWVTPTCIESGDIQGSIDFEPYIGGCFFQGPYTGFALPLGDAIEMDLESAYGAQGPVVMLWRVQ